MTPLATLKCPHCAADLVTEGVTAGQRLLCAGCRRSFRLEAGGRAVVSASQRAGASGNRAVPLSYSRTASAARWLGFLSFLPLVGLAALAAGLLGVRDLRRHPGRRGLGRAVFGLVAGGLTTLGWLLVGLVVGMGIYFAHSIKSTTDPAEIADIASHIGTFTVPPGLGPLHGDSIPPASMRIVRYGKKSNPGAPGRPAPLDVDLVVMQMPQSLYSDRDNMENILRNQRRAGPWFLPEFVPEEKKQATYTIRGQPVAVTLTLGKEEGSGKRWREYLAIVSSEQRRLGVILVTVETGGLSEEEVRQFFESFQP
jgi:hypothetical protein